MSQKHIFPLSKLAEAIEKVINQHCSKVVWVKAEIVKLNHYPHTGHCYPDLVEKQNGKIVAEFRGNIWKSSFNQIQAKFKNVLNEELHDNMTVVVQAAVTYHPVFGLALNILDIDPEYTLGELARQRKETIKKLVENGLFDTNKQQQLPKLPKTIAIISVSSSKGYQDFMHVLNENPWGYKFHCKLFPAILQGQRAVATINAQLERIAPHKDIFDAVAIIRGGGGDIGLSCYDQYSLAEKIARFPLPILTGIGHASNETVSEMVSFQNFITPTKMGEFLLQEFHNFSHPLKENLTKITTVANQLFERHNTRLNNLSSTFRFLAEKTLTRHFHELQRLEESLFLSSKTLLKQEKVELKNILSSITLLSPQNILKRGYSITRKDGEIVTASALLTEGDLVETQFSSGKVTSTIQSSKS